MTDPRTVFAMLLVIGFLLLTAIGMFFQIPERNQDMVNAAMNALGTALGAAVMALLRTDKADDAKTQTTDKAFDAITAATKGPSGTPDYPVKCQEPAHCLYPPQDTQQAFSEL